ncbi:MAG: hypothetical protein OEN50_15215, partial [Deltaproteobacteria bacterium]|nr:hypothetical protein [Deltaproteobacteria bacterium]
TVQELTEDLVKSALDNGGEDNVTVQFIQYGTRREARAVRPPQPAKPIPIPAAGPKNLPPQRQRAPRRTLAAFVISGIVVASFLVVYYVNSLKTAELDASKEIAGELRKELATIKASLEKATKRIEELEKQLTDEKQSARVSSGRLQKDLQDARAARDKAEKQAKDLTEQLAAEKQSAKGTAAKFDKELQAANTAKKNALTEANDLGQKLKGKERELQEAQKQLENLTKARKALPAQQETTPTKDASGNAPTPGAKSAPATK